MCNFWLTRFFFFFLGYWKFLSFLFQDFDRVFFGLDGHSMLFGCFFQISRGILLRGMMMHFVVSLIRGLFCRTF
ncbi:MAG: hypothetical protein EBZ74_12205 [Planctomycetia bacterium]|nr:hypothetical protein [Planctomycetia bacterium]